jgi:hypothetical protein
LNWRTLENPAAKATSTIVNRVVSINKRAACARCARANANGLAPTPANSKRSTWRVL